MPLDALFTLEIIEAMKNFLKRKRPPLHIRPQLDIDYKTENQSIIIFEIRPQWDNPAVIQHLPFAKATFVKNKNCWKVFWMRADFKWHSYTPKPDVKTIKHFAQLVEEDRHHCFFG